MVQVTNLSPGVRILHVKQGDAVVTRALRPKESADLDLADPKSKFVKGLIEAGDIVLGGKVARSADAELGDPDEDTLAMAELRQSFDDAWKGLQDQNAALQKAVDEQRDKIADLERQLADAKKDGAPSAQASAYAVKETSPGWFAVTKDGATVTKGLRASEVEGFDKLSDDEKAKFVERNKSAAA